jgi:2-polyprenyl-3-methyl-5-hydroxy-6-metoxy-1,4-benzoquinol methylase
MRLIDNNKINLDLLKICLSKPEIFTKSTAKFWDDEYISEQMLKFHLNPDIESASKTKATIEAEAEFIIKTTALSDGKALLDLGCGPGLYVREFAKTGATVTGVDFSGRSIDYANQHVKSEYNNTLFIKMNYLDLNFKESFDIATIIYYDFSALNTTEQNRLLAKIHTALKDNGYFIFDVLTEIKKTSVATNISVHESGFWSPKPHLEILNSFLYEDPKTEGLQYTIIEEDGSTRVIRIYHRLFSLAEITEMLNANGFQVEKVYQNLKGEVLSKDSETYGIIARKV